MANEALRQLEQLDSLGAKGQQAANEVQQVQEQFLAQGDTAEFDWPDALKTGVAAGWILGPAGGLAIGLAQGFLNKQAKQSLLDEQANYNATIEQLEGIYSDQFQTARDEALTKEDMAQIDGAEALHRAGFQASLSQDEQVAAMGREQMVQAQGTLEEWRRTNETQAIARNNLLTAEQDANYKDLLGKYDAQSANYVDTMMSTDIALEALVSGSPVDINAALTMVAKALDPSGVVTDAAVAQLSGSKDLLDMAKRILNQAVGDGAPLLKKDREEMAALLNNIRERQTVWQTQKDVEFQDRAGDLRLPQNMIDNFNTVKKVPGLQLGEMQEREGTTEQTVKGAGEAAKPVINRFSDQSILQGLRNMNDAIQELFPWTDVIPED